MSEQREPFYFSKAAGGFADLTRWMKDAFAALRGNLIWVFVVIAIWGGMKLYDKFFPPKKVVAPVQVETNNGKLENGSDKRVSGGLIVINK